MKKFKYPLAITGTKNQMDELVPKLMSLGYSWDDGEGDDYNAFPCLWTCFDDRDKLSFFTEMSSSSPIRTKVSASNQELVLALAAMVDDDNTYAGEYTICTYTYNDVNYGLVEKGTFMQLKKDGKNTSTAWRKATKEEIIDHFTPTKEPIAYEVVTNILTWPHGTLLHRHKDKWIPEKTFDLNDHRIEFIDDNDNILKSKLFKPIYKEEPKVIKVLMHSEPDNFLLEVSKDGIYYRPDNCWIAINDIRRTLTIEPPTIRMSRDKDVTLKVYDVKPSHFNCGCQKMVPREDIENVLKVYDELNGK